MSTPRKKKPEAGCSQPQAVDGFRGQSDFMPSHNAASRATDESNVLPDLPDTKVLFDRARPGGEHLRLSVEQFRGNERIDLRLWYKHKSGELRHGTKGLTVPEGLIPELIVALAAAGGVDLEDLVTSRES